MSKSFTIKVIDPVGLHARPATLLVNAANKFYSDVFVVYDGKKVNAKSIMGVMAAGIPTKATIEIIADGPDEDDALAKIEKLFKDEKVSA